MPSTQLLRTPGHLAQPWSQPNPPQGPDASHVQAGTDTSSVKHTGLLPPLKGMEAQPSLSQLDTGTDRAVASDRLTGSFLRVSVACMCNWHIPKPSSAGVGRSPCPLYMCSQMTGLTQLSSNWEPGHRS